MVVTGLVGALVKTSYKWGYFTFGCVAFLFVAWTVSHEYYILPTFNTDILQVVFEGRAYARQLGADINKTYTICGVWTIGLWFLYPIAWGLCEGGNVISSDSEAIFYGILDLLAKPVFGALLLWGHRNIDPARVGLHIRDPRDPGNTVFNEKNGHSNAHSNGHSTGTDGGVTGQGITNNQNTTTGVTPVHNNTTV